MICDMDKQFESIDLLYLVSTAQVCWWWCNMRKLPWHIWGTLTTLLLHSNTSAYCMNFWSCVNSVLCSISWSTCSPETFIRTDGDFNSLLKPAMSSELNLTLKRELQGDAAACMNMPQAENHVEVTIAMYIFQIFVRCSVQWNVTCWRDWTNKPK